MNLFALVNGAPWIFGPVTFAGTITFTGSALLADGSAAAPALAFAADTDTGIYRPGANEIAFVTGGTERASFISQGLKLSNGGGTFTVPSIFANGDSDTGLALIGGNQLALVVGGATALCLNASGNGLFGTTTDSGNGRIQLATHSTSAGGIGFGTDLSLYRANTGFLILNDASAALDARIGLYNNGTQRGLFEAYNVNTAIWMGAASAGWSTIITSGNQATALTLDSSQNATFANGLVAGKAASVNSITGGDGGVGTSIIQFKDSGGTTKVNIGGTGILILSSALRLGNAYQAGAPTATGYVTIQDSSGTTYKVLVGT